jgi:hypothetical protein
VSARREVVEHRIDDGIVGFDQELVDRQPAAAVVGGPVDDEPLCYAAIELQLDRKCLAWPELTPAAGKAESQGDGERFLRRPCGLIPGLSRGSERQLDGEKNQCEPDY